MKKQVKQAFLMGFGLLATFALWTWLMITVDVQSVGVNGTAIGFATLNRWFHQLTGIHMKVYIITDWLGLVPVFVGFFFSAVGLVQLVGRKGLLRVDHDILLLGVHYIIVLFGYLIFEMIPINYRPILINGCVEASYPSSTTLLVLGVMPTLVFQSERRLKSATAKNLICCVTIAFSAFMVIGRLISGVHWLTDIVGSVLLSAGLFSIYRAAVLLCRKNGG